MNLISISEHVRQKLPDLVLGVIGSEILIEQNTPLLWEEMNITAQKMNKGLAEVSQHPAISASRKAYKAFGKDPARYRTSSEALMRRVIKGLELPHVNNIVDLINLVSLQSGLSIGGYDMDKIKGYIRMDIGQNSDEYEAIGRGKFNIDSLPVLRDENSAFGSPTSDSERTCVTLDTKSFLMVIFGFSGEEDTMNAVDLSVDLLKKYAEAQKIETLLIR